jgi:hypothetical protein
MGFKHMREADIYKTICLCRGCFLAENSGARPRALTNYHAGTLASLATPFLTLNRRALDHALLQAVQTLRSFMGNPLRAPPP